MSLGSGIAVVGLAAAAVAAVSLGHTVTCGFLVFITLVTVVGSFD